MYYHTIEEITAEVEKIVVKAKADFSDLSYEQLNWKPNAESWSVGQCLDHLAQSAAVYQPLFKDLANGTQKPNFWRKVPFLPSMFGRMILKAVQPERTKKGKTFSVFEPTQSDISTDIIEKLEKELRTFSSLAVRLDGFDLEKTMVTSPVGAFVNYSLLYALNIVTVHNYRHFNQAEEVMKMTDFPK